MINIKKNTGVSSQTNGRFQLVNPYFERKKPAGLHYLLFTKFKLSVIWANIVPVKSLRLHDDILNKYGNQRVQARGKQSKPAISEDLP